MGRALAAGDNQAWALGMDGILQLDPRPGAKDEMVPGLHIQDAFGLPVQKLQGLGDRALLALDPQGRFFSWPLNGAPPTAWNLPSKVPWSGICGTDTSLFFVSSPSDGRPAALWRLP